VFGVAYIKMDMVNGFDLQEIRLLGHGAGFGLGYGCSHSASFELALSAAYIAAAEGLVYKDFTTKNVSLQMKKLIPG
jgi:hypothetical protein